MGRIVVVTMLVALGSIRVGAQPILQLKVGVGGANKSESVPRTLVAGEEYSQEPRRHRVIQFAEAPADEVRAALEARGARVLQYVPDNALLVNVPAGINLDGLGRVLYHDALAADQKWSPGLDPKPAPGALLAPEELTQEGSTPPRRFVVEFYPDVENAQARALVTRQQMAIREHADIMEHHLLVEGTREQARRLAASDEVAYLFPPSVDLERGAAVHNCGGAVTQFGSVGQYIARVGDGWDGPGRNAARLSYLIENVAARLPPDAAQVEIQRALAEWARYVQLDFTPGGRASDRGHIDIRFARGSHGDPYAFDGPGRVLAHTFYPAPPNPEPLAGDVHLDDDEGWKIGNDVDLYSVVLHELGHAVGLAHSDKPGSVMYAYYRRTDGLTAEDIAAVRELYAPRTTMPGNSDPPPATPTPAPPQPPVPAPTPTPTSPASPPIADRIAPSLSIVSPGSTSYSTAAASITVRGAASDNVGVTKVTWSSNVAGSGSAQGALEWSAEIPLAKGTNSLTFRAWDAASNTSWRSLVVTRR